ncbi:MAG TPA: glycosyltransferase [Longimicrobiaceae bacterium]|nr:glycosyltransferase [Longimicrobiaceae bacterium]
MTGPVTAGIGTRNRPEALVRCLRSLALAGDLVGEVVVVDDASDEPLEPPVRAALGADAPPRLRFIRFETNRNVSAARNAIARAASTPWVLNLDDDAFLVSGDAVRAAVEVLEHDPVVAGVAFGQGDEQGRPWPDAAQPAPVDYPCYVATFVGYGNLLRRDAFLAAGGFREQLGINGEEKELALRLLDAGWRIVYLPGAVVGHVAAAAGRDARRYLHQTVRNSTLSAIYNEPFPLVVFGALERLRRYFPMRKGWKIDDPGGFGRVVAEVARGLPEAWRQRRPVRWSTLRRWRRLTGSAPEPYAGPAPP